MPEAKPVDNGGCLENGCIFCVPVSCRFAVTYPDLEKISPAFSRRTLDGLLLGGVWKLGAVRPPLSGTRRKVASVHRGRTPPGGRAMARSSCFARRRTRSWLPGIARPRTLFRRRGRARPASSRSAMPTTIPTWPGWEALPGAGFARKALGAAMSRAPTSGQRREVARSPLERWPLASAGGLFRR